MAPKKKHHQQKHHHKANPKSSNPQSSSSSGTKQGPKLQLSEENERRLRRLLLNTEIPFTTTIESDNLSIDRKAKKLRNVYDKLSLEGFPSDQIEKALSALNVETSKIFLRETTVISPYSILLFGGSISVQHQIAVTKEITGLN